MPLNRDNSVTFDLRIDPADAASPKVRYALRKITGVENVREVITWAHALMTRVFPGMGATTGPGQLRLMDAVLEGTPRFLCMENSGTHANANRAQRALQYAPFRTVNPRLHTTPSWPVNATTPKT